MRFRARIDDVRIGPSAYRVIRPVRPLVRAALYAGHGLPTEPYSLAMFVDRTSSAVLMAAWAMATVSRHSLVYRPQIRRRLGAGRPHTARLSGNVMPSYDDLDFGRTSHRDFLDHLRIKVSGHKVLVIGSPIAFQHWGHVLRRLALEAGPTVKNTNDAHHFCVEIDDWRASGCSGYTEDWTNLHIAYSPHWKVY